MQKLNRSQPPQTSEPPRPALPNVELTTTTNHIPLLTIHNQKDPILILTIITRAGTWFSDKAPIAPLAAAMITKGTANHDADAIADTIARHGARLSTSTTRDHLIIHCELPATHANNLLPLIGEMIAAPTFPSERLVQIKKIMAQRVRQQEADTRKKTLKRLRKEVFGSNHPYGCAIEEKDITAIEAEELATHHHNYKGNKPQLFLLGAITDNHLAAVEKLSQTLTPNTPKTTPSPPPQPPPGTTTHVKSPHTAQEAIAMGISTIPITHPDFPDLYIVNKLLGDSFGSRLTKNLREKHSYTYGIRTSLYAQQQGSYWQLFTTIKKGTINLAIDQIAHEIERLHREPVGKRELEDLKSYLHGELLCSFDDIFGIHDHLLATYPYGLTLHYYSLLHKAITAITPQRIQEIALRYINPTAITKVLMQQEHPQKG